MSALDQGDDTRDGADLRRFAQRADLLVAAVQELSLARDLAEIQRIVRTTARALTGSDGTTFVLNDGGLYCYYADEDAIAPLWKGLKFPQETCISGWVMRNRQAVIVPDIYADPRIPHDAYRPTFVKSLTMVPIRTLDPIGAIGAYWADTHVPTSADLQLLQALADSTSVAMENLRVQGELERRVIERTEELTRANSAIRALSVTDELTGLTNRRGFYTVCERAMAHIRRVMLVYLDVDGLKRVNDLHGHAAGDDMLTGFAAVLRVALPEANVLARLGGDEFCAALFDPVASAEDMRRRLAAALDVFNAAATRPYRLSFSLGIVEAEGGDAGMLDSLLQQADELMYREKNARRVAN
ncbi:sensor domain-containing diguanylate cyclase [Ancylobacter koreensis]|uniref:sensor domain-containing diguanylate cyclase n=1 Tax=Ancylobacter koreensis TaxID=266121 RepID=UPI001FF392B0